MAKALSVHVDHASPDDRPAAIATLRERREALKPYGCNYWVFEDPSIPGAYTEFIEARDVESLRVARRALGVERVGDQTLVEVEL